MTPGHLYESAAHCTQLLLQHSGAASVGGHHGAAHEIRPPPGNQCTVQYIRYTLNCQRADSDLADPDLADPPDWRSSLTPEQLGALTATEQKRQDVINELFHTERSHVRNLKVPIDLLSPPRTPSVVTS